MPLRSVVLNGDAMSRPVDNARTLLVKLAFSRVQHRPWLTSDDGSQCLVQEPTDEIPLISPPNFYLGCLWYACTAMYQTSSRAGGFNVETVWCTVVLNPLNPRPCITLRTVNNGIFVECAGLSEIAVTNDCSTPEEK